MMNERSGEPIIGASTACPGPVFFHLAVRQRSYKAYRCWGCMPTVYNTFAGSVVIRFLGFVLIAGTCVES